MADKKSDQAEQAENENPLVKKVDKMMDIKGVPAEPTVPAGPDNAKSDVAAVAASVNQALSEELGASKENPKSAPELPDAPKPSETPSLSTKAPATEPEAAAEPAADGLKDDKLDDQETDKAVDEIAASEGDLVLAVEDAKRARQAKTTGDSGGHKFGLGAIFKGKRPWLMLLVLLLVVFGFPYTRYKVLGLAVKKSVSFTVLDNKTQTPVSNAEVSLAGHSVKTDAEGHAKVKASLGKHDLTVSKKYYSELKTSYFVGFKASSPKVTLKATGRLVPVTVLNSITGRPVPGVQVQSQGTSAKTDAKGKANIALPADAPTGKGDLSLSGYNTAAVTIQITDDIVKANSFNLTPSGHVYFLSNRSGNLDVVKSNLDGSGRKTILAGTGKEDPRSTSLLAARDWHYLVLKAKREGSQEALYLIDTSNDKVTLFDNSTADFQLVGWYGHDFIYELTHSDYQPWQANRQALKSYDADHQQLNLLDQSKAEGTKNRYAYQQFTDFYVLDDQVVYTTTWFGYGGPFENYNLSGKPDTVRGVHADGTAKKDYRSFSAGATNFIQSTIYSPGTVYYGVENYKNQTSYYTFDGNSVKASDIDQSAFGRGYPTYLLSPSGRQTFWTDLRDGKNSLFIGDATASGGKQVASLSDFSPYGWFSDDYVLVSKDSSELYISSPAGLTANRQPLKITDYYKPAQTYEGYGYGYGGL